MLLKTLLAFITLFLAVPTSFDSLRSEAEKSFEEKSFSRARELYEQASALQLEPRDRRWVEFRLADTTWRAVDANDHAVREKARLALEDLIRRSGVDHDRVWAEVNESLGDLTRGTGYHLAALDWWAGSSELGLARRRYLAIVWRVSDGGMEYAIPREVLVNAVAVAESAKDRARARHLLASNLLRDGRPDSAERALEHLEAVIREGKTSDWYDDALALAARTYAAARNVVVESGAVERKSDFARALELYRRLVSEFAKGETPHREFAQSAIEEITAPATGVNVSGTFLPDSEQEVLLTWRNVKRIELTLMAVDLTEVKPRKDGDWIEGLRAGPTIRKWTHETNDSGEHQPGMAKIRLTPRLERGAYLMTAQANGKSAKQLVLVTDAHILLQALPKRLQIHVADVLTGEPIAGARVLVIQGHGDQQTVESAETNSDGLATVTKSQNYTNVVVTAVNGRRQAWHSTYAYTYGGELPRWTIYAFTDRPAYRPDETVQWKIIARTSNRDEWATPAGARLAYEITSPRGEKVSAGEAALNAFGSFWGELPLTPAMALGAYNITFQTIGKDAHHAGSAKLFRLEEYKLPEFQVSVTTPEENGKRKLYRVGDTIETTVEASYYFGGPVANATVEAVVHQQPFFRAWFPWREYNWYYDRPWQHHGGAALKSETLKTDANGRAVVHIETSPDAPEMEYRIEARVVDASRREVRGQGSVRVTKQRYFVIAHPEHYLHRPGESVEIDLKALDANDQPVEATGKVSVVRREWRDKHRAYREENVTETSVSTNEKGEATFTFTPRARGYYTVRWSSVDRGTAGFQPAGPARVRDIVRTETSVWVADPMTRDLGYFTGSGLEIIIDRETVRAGQTAAVMIVTPVSGRWVVFNTMGDDVLDTQVLHLDGTVKLVQIPIDSRHVPNFFVSASSIFNRVLSTDSERVVVPPVEHFINVDVKTDREQYLPRQEGIVTITTRDVDGKPVSAEVAVAVSDEAVTAIQTDLAGDPRQFFFGNTRQQLMQVSGGVQSQQYVRLVEGVEKRLINDRYRDLEVAGQKAGRLDEGAQYLGANARLEYDGISPHALPLPGEPGLMVTAAAPQLREGERLFTKSDATAAAAIDVQVRSDFRSTAFWKPDVMTDAGGTATVRFKYPEALTTWGATARAASAATQFGIGSATARTNMPLIVRLQAPRFFVQGDRSVVSAVINNNTGAAMRVEPRIDVEGLALGGDAAPAVDVPAHGEARADWTVVAEKPGTAKLRVSGRGPKFGDAMEKSFLVWEHGIDKLIARSGRLRSNEAIVKLELPRERRATDLVVQVAPSLAVTMLDALPYLIDYPYGCTEQTMSRFLPAAIVAGTLQKMGLEARKRIPKLDEVTKASIARLYDFQHGDGGWGWWKEGESDAWMTAYVVWGFAVARDAGMKVDENRIDNAFRWLDEHLVHREKERDEQAWMLHAMSAWNRARQSKSAKDAFDNVWEQRERLTSYARALLALTAHRWNNKDRAAVLVRNLENGAKIDRTPDQWSGGLQPAGSPRRAEARRSTPETMATAHWGEDRFWWRWHDGPVETTAFVLQALAAIDRKHKLVEPSMNWLVKNRRGAQWSNTRDTAIAVLSLNDYLRASGETIGDVSYEVSVNGRVIATKKLTAREILVAPSRFSVDPSILQDSEQEIRIRANAPVYFSAEARFVSLEEPVKAAGNELFVRREYFRLAPRPTLLKGVLYDRLPLGDGDSIPSGERVEVVLTVETKNDYEYLMFEDLEPAGFEAVELQSGQPLFATGKEHRSQWVYQELRDRKVAMFASRLAQGVWEIRYTLRAETPGSFHALPLLGQAMYVPEVRANGEELRVAVLER